MHNAYKTEPDYKYYCKYCDTYHNCKGFSKHLSSHHGIIFKNYIKENLELFIEFGWKLCPSCNENVIRGTTCSKKCFGIWRSINCRGVNPWLLMSDETAKITKESLSKKKLGIPTGINPWERMSPETREECSRKISEAAKLRLGPLSSFWGKKHSPETIQKIFKYRKMTDIEKIINDFLIDNNIEFYFQYFISKNSTHSYDFKIKGINLIIEIDGDYWHGGPGTNNWDRNVEKTKSTDELKTQIANEIGFIVLRFWGSELVSNPDKVFETILTEINRFEQLPKIQIKKLHPKATKYLKRIH